MGYADNQRNQLILDRDIRWVVALKWDLPQAWRIFLTVGICGGYTTFSTFSLDAFYFMERNEAVAAIAYMIGSLVLSVGALVAAMQLSALFQIRTLLG